MAIASVNLMTERERELADRSSSRFGMAKPMGAGIHTHGKRDARPLGNWVTARGFGHGNRFVRASD